MDFLISLGTSASYFFSAAVAVTKVFSRAEVEKQCTFETAAMLLTFVALGKVLESIARGRTTAGAMSFFVCAHNNILL